MGDADLQSGNCRFCELGVPSVGMTTDIEILRVLTGRDHLLRRREIAGFGISAAVFQRWEDEGRWLQVTPDHLRHLATPLTFEMQVIAGSEWLGRRGMLFGASALSWMGILESTPLQPEWLTSRDRRWILAWIRLHTTTRSWVADATTVRGVRTSHAARALIDFCSTKPTAAHCEMLIERAVSMRLTSLPTLRKRLAVLSGSGRHGCSFLRELLLDSGGESFLERRFLRLVRINGVSRPETQVIFRRNGTHIARVDFLYGKQRVVVEVTGRLGHVSDRDRQRDARRRNALQQSGFEVIEFTTADVIDDPGYVLATLQTSLCVTP